MDFKYSFVTIFIFLLELGVLSNGKTVEPKYDSTSHDNNANSVNNAVKTSILPSLTTSMKPMTRNAVWAGRPSTKSFLLAQKLDGSTGLPSTNKTAVKGVASPKDGEDGFPLWAYILIGVLGVLVIILLLTLAYTRFIKWKDHGTYMVWDDAELETSPAFTRESEFLLETSTGGQEMVSPELQLYEIPLDSVNHPRIAYMGSKRVAPKRLDDRRRKEGEFNVPSLTRYKKRDTVYNSVTDTCMTSVMSEGTLDDGSTSRHTLATVMLSSGGLDKYGSTYHNFDISTKGASRSKSHSMDHRTRSVTNLIQSRPLPAVPINKRFSKSLDKLRFFNTLPVIKPKSKCKLPLPQPASFTKVVKSASYGSNLQRIVNNNNCIDQTNLSSRKGSLDLQTNVLPQKSMLSYHRKSKSLDTLMLLKEIDWNAMNVDIYHSYESVHGTKSEDGEYASVSDSQPSSPTAYSDNLSPKSPKKSSSLTTPDDIEQESIYASVSQEDLHDKTIQNENGNVNEGNDANYDSNTMSSISSDTSPYATVRISQIPGLSYDHDSHEPIYSTKTPEHSGGSMETTENSGSTISEIKPSPNSARSSTHTYLELFPVESNRDSIISETSSGYARPVDVLKGIERMKDSDKSQEKILNERKSLTDMKIPIESAISFDNEVKSLADTCNTMTGDKEAYDNPVKVSDEEYQKDKDIEPKTSGNKLYNKTYKEEKHNITPLVRKQTSHKDELPEESRENEYETEWPARARTYSEHSECEI